MSYFNGLGMNLGNLSRLSNAESRSITAENPDGSKSGGAKFIPREDDPVSYPATELGNGWKCQPYCQIKPGEIKTVADIDGPGAIQSIWCTGGISRFIILRIYWENQPFPQVETPICDFFALPWGDHHLPRTNPDFYPVVNSMPVAVNPLNGLNAFWEMPFRKHCRITVENRHAGETINLYYQINYTLTDIPDDAALFHAQFRRKNPLDAKTPYPILDNVSGQGHYVGTVMGWGINNCGWWGEGEIKFFIDDDDEYPTICGTGTEDYFCGSYNWDLNGYKTYTTNFAGMHQVIHPDGLYNSQQRHAMYRWHIMDPIRFRKNLKVTIQALGWRDRGKFLAHRPDISSVAFWYQQLPSSQFPPLPGVEELEVI